MKLNLLAFAVPLFLFFIGLEYYLSKRRGKNYFQYAESIANINVGIAERLLDLFTTGLFFYWFDYLHRHFALFDIRANAVTWIVLFLLTDLVWYWYHRFAHEVNAFWAVHVVHHQSEDFNYTVSARITVFQAVVRSGFWSVLPLVGFPAHMTAVLLLIHGAYPFFIHTRTIGKLGWLEKIFVTPSHHRVHHASNPEYLDKNYGDVLIIWDKFFGTFVEEKAAPVYGLTKPLGSHSFLWQHFHFPLEMLLAFRHARGWRAKWQVVFGPPDDLDPRFRAILERRLSNVRRFREPSPALRQYITAQTIGTLLLLFLMLLFAAHFTGIQLFLLTLFLLLSLVTSGAMLDQRSWIFYLEVARVGVLALMACIQFRNGWTLAGMLVLGSLLIRYFEPAKKRYLAFLYR